MIQLLAVSLFSVSSVFAANTYHSGTIGSSMAFAMDTGSGLPAIAPWGVNFGDLGTGTMTFHNAVNVSNAILSSGSQLTPGTYSLHGGDELVLGQHTLPGSTVPSTDGVRVSFQSSGAPASALLTFKLDSGFFSAGDLFIVSNISRQNDNAGAVVLGSAFEAPKTGDPLITGLTTNAADPHPNNPFGVWGQDSNGDDIYAVMGVPTQLGYMNKSGGQVFRFAEDTNEFTIRLLIGDYGVTGQDGNGITPLASPNLPFSFTFATQQVPEPSGFALALLGGMGMILRRRRR